MPPQHAASTAGESEETGSSAAEETCAGGHSCCVVPIILAFMVGAFLRQLFNWFKHHYYYGIPPYTIVVLAFGAGFTVLAEHNSWLAPYIQCLMVRGSTVLHAALPLIVFQPAFMVEMQVFKKSLNQVLMLAVTGYAMQIALTAMAVKYLFHTKWNMYTAIIYGVVVSATDPLAVDDAVKVSGVSLNLAALMQGESMIGDAVGMIAFRLFMVLLMLEYHLGVASPTEEITLFAVECCFAPFFGIMVAILTVFWLSRIFNDATLEITIVLSVVHLAYYVSELLGLPGMVTVLFYGLYMSSSRASISPTVEAIMKKSFQVLTDIYNSVVYFYAGVFFVRHGIGGSSSQDFLHDFLLWIAINFIRALMVFFMSPVLRRLGLGMSWQYMLTIWISSLNGAFNILLNMMAAQNLTTVFNTQVGMEFYRSALMLLILKQVFNTSSTRLLLRIFGLRSMPKFHQISLANAKRLLNQTRDNTINALKSDRFMADAGFDIVEADTQVDDMFWNFSQRRLSVSKIFKKMTRNSVIPAADISEVSEDQRDEAREDKLEAIHLLLKAQKKTYWRHFERGLMSKEALHQLIDWADSAADHKGKFLDVRKVKEASQVRPLLKSLKRQVKIKLRQLHHEAATCRGWLDWQQQVLPIILSYGFHVIDTLITLFAVVLAFVKIEDAKMDQNMHLALMFWNGSVVGVYGMIALGELLVMRLRFFKIVWHNITMVIVLVGLLDILVMTSLGQTKRTGSKGYVAQVFTRLLFIFSRLVRLLGLVEIMPWILAKFLKLLEQRISGQLGVGFDICCAYVTGQVEVSRWLEALVQDPAIVIELKRHCNKSKLEIIKTLGILALENPTIALSVKTRQAMRVVLNAEHDTVKELRSEGALQDSDAALLTKDVEERMKKLLTAPPLVDDDSEDSIIRNVGWVQGDENLFHYIKDNMEIWNLKANTIITEQGQDDYSIYIIKSGVARLERATDKYYVSVMDFMTAGNVVGEINFLTKAIRFKTVRCETPVTVLALTEETLELALERSWSKKLPPLLYRMWLVIAKRVAIKVFMDDPDFQAQSNDYIRMHLFGSYLVDNLNGNSLNIHNDPRDDVILIHGYARDAFTRQPFRGPSYIPRTCFQLQLQPDEGLYPLVLIVPVEPIEMDEYDIHPTRRGSNIDHNVLASGSIEALKLEELFRATHQTEDHGPISPQSTMDRRQFMQTGNGNSSESSSDDDSCVSTATYTHVLPDMPNDQEIVVQSLRNPLNPKKEKHEKHLPFGTWDLSDTLEDVPRQHIPEQHHNEESKNSMGRASTSIDSFVAPRQ